ncbi:MAG: metallophosphoesterase family protein [Nanopusillaceae archaeon]
MIEYKELEDLIKDAIEILKNEYKDIIEKEIEKAIIIGDIHGDIFSLNKSLEYYENDEYIIFLGDYLDRGNYQIEVLYKILKLKVENPEKVILLRGNHEFFDIEFYPHDFPLILYRNYGENGIKLYKLYREFANYLPFILYIPDFAIILHGGIPRNIDFLNNLSYEDKIEIVWNDPYEGKGFSPNYWRDIGYLFGEDIVNKVIEKYKVKYIIRGHFPPCFHSNNLITIFTSKEPYNLDKVCIGKINDNKIDLIEI